MAGVSFTSAWRKLGETREMLGEAEEFQKFLGAEFQRGFDGKKHLKPLPLFLRFSYSLCTALVGAALGAYLLKWMELL